MTVTQLRADFGNLINLVSAEVRANELTKEDAKQELETVSRRWRAVDPSNRAIDSIIGDALSDIGEPIAAWRQISTGIELQPMSATGWVAAAEWCQRQGDVSTAIEYWHEAMTLDQTNPRWRFQNAEALIAAGKREEGRALFEATLKQRWHQRYQWEVENARYQFRLMQNR
jgi:predicted Zn-dependent protease